MRPHLNWKSALVCRPKASGRSRTKAAAPMFRKLSAVLMDAAATPAKNTPASRLGAYCSMNSGAASSGLAKLTSPMSAR